MTGKETLDTEKLKAQLEAAWRRIPKPFRSERTVQRTLQCHLFSLLKDMGFDVVADYLPPLSHDRPIDLIIVSPEHQIHTAICFDTLVTLAAVKSLTSFEATHKLIFTTGKLEKKVKESRFFLKPEVHHIHLKPFETF